MLALHPNARTTPAVRAETARSSEGSGVPARRYGVSAETIREWRKRGTAAFVLRRSAKGSPPSRASLREARAFSRASANETRLTSPRPVSRRHL